MNPIAWIHVNCSFSVKQRRKVWALLRRFGYESVIVEPAVKEAAAPAAPQPPLSTGTPQAYDIVIADNPDIGFSQDARPCLVTRVLGNGMFEVSPITSQFGLGTRWRSPGDFPVKGDHPQFQSTSLKKPGIILDQSMVIPQSAIRRTVGKLAGDILREYLDHTGR